MNRETTSTLIKPRHLKCCQCCTCTSHRLGIRKHYLIKMIYFVYILYPSVLDCLVQRTIWEIGHESCLAKEIFIKHLADWINQLSTPSFIGVLQPIRSTEWNRLVDPNSCHSGQQKKYLFHQDEPFYRLCFLFLSSCDYNMNVFGSPCRASVWLLH